MRVAFPDGCYGMDMDDGTHYTRDRLGGAIISDSDHIKAIGKAAFLGKPLHRVQGSGYDCKCGHGCWDWQDECPRCHRRREDGD